MATWGDDGDFSFFVAGVNSAIGKDWGGGEITTDALGPDDITGLGIETGGDATVIDGVEEVIDEEERRFIGGGFFQAPGEGFWAEEAVATEFDGDHLSLGIADGDEDHAEAGDGSSGGAVIIAFFEAPEFFTGFGVVAVVGFGAATDEGGLAIVGDDLGCGESLSVIAFVLGFAIFVEVLVIDGSVDFPDGFSREFIEGDDELGIAAVEVHDE